MTTLLLRLAAPLQSWGTDSEFETRSTGKEPSKSAVIGMIAAALGRSREDSIEDLRSLVFGVRADQEGTFLKDFHKARVYDLKKERKVRKKGDCLTSSSSFYDTKNKSVYLSDRFYLDDACFVVGLEGERTLLEDIVRGLENPYYPIFLGRRSCPPTGRLVLGIRECGLLDALRSEEWQASQWYRRRQSEDVSLRLIYELEPAPGVPLVRDVPLSFSRRKRTHGYRGVGYDEVRMKNEIGRKIRRFDPVADAKKEAI